MTGLGAMMAGGNPADGREDDDFYPTPIEVPWGLLKAERFVGDIHECACGDGAMARVFEKVGHKVVGTDLVARGYGRQISFFDIHELQAPNIVTNPPFNLATEFIEHALALRPEKLALLLPSNFWYASGRSALFSGSRPKFEYKLTWRPDFKKLGKPVMQVMWCVWERGYAGETMTRLMPNPRKQMQKPSISTRKPSRRAL